MTTQGATALSLPDGDWPPVDHVEFFKPPQFFSSNDRAKSQEHKDAKVSQLKRMNKRLQRRRGTGRDKLIEMYLSLTRRVSRTTQYSQFAKTALGALVPIPLARALETWDFVPQAILNVPVDAIANSTGMSHLSVGHDDFDAYSGAAFAIAGVPFAIMNYQGHPPNTSTIYLPHQIQNVKTITGAISNILKRFRLTTDAVLWQRKDDPDL